MAPGIIEIGSTQAFDQIVKSLPPSQLLVVGTSSVWCGPCHAIAPILAQLAQKYPHVKFVKIDVDAQAELARRFQISAMPTFKFLKGGQVIDELRGASPPQLTQLVQKHAGAAPSSGASKAGGAQDGPAAPAEGSLLSHISATGLSCLGEAKEHPLSSIVGPNAGPKGRSYLESDVDPELLISMQFNEPVKIKALSIFSVVSPAQAPKTVRLYVNQNHMDFGDAEAHEPAQELVLSPDDIRGNKVELRFVRFQKVHTLHILVKDNQEDDETTRIDSIDLFGQLA
ncbi:uncharacterized protein COLE_03610 [Cutaneotrichosporon oleaginosum]|uniref:uncharacterized protein n=1 Tax=Cutaneotrichosporon oleaginosum TaxID=879819 RepID=UPI0013255CFE|nr:hypothetical protein COLE_03610 [Cutaneotrichosporon oleaginosum]